MSATRAASSGLEATAAATRSARSGESWPSTKAWTSASDNGAGGIVFIAALAGSLDDAQRRCGLADQSAQPVPRARQPRHDRANRDRQHARDVLVAHLFDGGE